MTDENKKDESDVNSQSSSEEQGDKTTINSKAGPTFIELLMNPEAVKGIENLLINVIDHTRKNNTSERWFMGICLVTIIGAIVGLSIFEKLNPSAGVILGSLAGYVFGKREE